MSKISKLIRAQAEETRILRPVYMAIPESEESEKELICFSSGVTPKDSKKINSRARVHLAKSKGIDESEVETSGLDLWVFTIIQKLKVDDKGEEPAFSPTDADALYDMDVNWLEHVYEQIVASEVMVDRIKKSGKTAKST